MSAERKGKEDNKKIDMEAKERKILCQKRWRENEKRDEISLGRKSRKTKNLITVVMLS